MLEGGEVYSNNMLCVLSGQQEQLVWIGISSKSNTSIRDKQHNFFAYSKNDKQLCTEQK